MTDLKTPGNLSMIKTAPELIIYTIIIQLQLFHNWNFVFNLSIKIFYRFKSNTNYIKVRFVVVVL